MRAGSDVPKMLVQAAFRTEMRTVLANIQVLRAFAALAVVAYHTSYRVPGLLHTDLLGVAIFFVISGFIMSYIGRESAADFLMRRIIRIVPLYWIGLLGYAAIVTILYPMMGKRTDIVVTTATLLQDLLFIPRTDSFEQIIHPILQVGWTLNLEMYFYVVFTTAILIGKKLAPALSAAVVLALWCVARFLELPPVVEFFGHDYVIYFALGICVFYYWDRFRASPTVGWLTLILGIVALAIFAITGSRILAYVAPPLLVYGSVAIDRCGLSIRSRPALLIGAASYALYLFHPFVLGLANTIFPALRGDFVFSATLLVISVFVAVAVHKAIEIPIQKALKPKPSPLLATS